MRELKIFLLIHLTLYQTYAEKWSLPFAEAAYKTLIYQPKKSNSQMMKTSEAKPSAMELIEYLNNKDPIEYFLKKKMEAKYNQLRVKPHEETASSNSMPVYIINDVFTNIKKKPNVQLMEMTKELSTTETSLQYTKQANEELESLLPIINKIVKSVNAKEKPKYLIKASSLEPLIKQMNLENSPIMINLDSKENVLTFTPMMKKKVVPRESQPIPNVDPLIREFYKMNQNYYKNLATFKPIIDDQQAHETRSPELEEDLLKHLKQKYPQKPQLNLNKLEYIPDNSLAINLKHGIELVSKLIEPLKMLMQTGKNKLTNMVSQYQNTNPNPKLSSSEQKHVSSKKPKVKESRKNNDKYRRRHKSKSEKIRRSNENTEEMTTTLGYEEDNTDENRKEEQGQNTVFVTLPSDDIDKEENITELLQYSTFGTTEITTSLDVDMNDNDDNSTTLMGDH